MSFRTGNPSPLPTFIFYPFALKASESHLLSRGSFVALWAWVMLLVSSVGRFWCLNDEEGGPWGSKCLSCVCRLPQVSSQWMQLKIPRKYNRKIVIFLRIALYYILLWPDNLFKGWQIVLSVWGTSLQPRFSCGFHRFPLLSICSVSKHKMSHQTTAQVLSQVWMARVRNLEKLLAAPDSQVLLKALICKALIQHSVLALSLYLY